VHPLFADLPAGFHYRERFIDEREEAALLDRIREIAFADFEMRGVVAKRRVAFFGASYSRMDTPMGSVAPEIPAFLLPVRARLAEWAGVAPDAFAMALINEYRPGAPIGWHRDAPQYDIVGGISLGSACRMRLRPYLSPRTLAAATDRQPRRTTHELTLMPRSAYLITALARSGYEHSIPAVDELRYSITFRTFRG
jgi:alkylated DNA repair dioxygenase AlkB